MYRRIWPCLWRKTHEPNPTCWRVSVRLKKNEKHRSTIEIRYSTKKRERASNSYETISSMVRAYVVFVDVCQLEWLRDRRANSEHLCLQTILWSIESEWEQTKNNFRLKCFTLAYQSRQELVQFEPISKSRIRCVLLFLLETFYINTQIEQ